MRDPTIDYKTFRTSDELILFGLAAFKCAVPFWYKNSDMAQRLYRALWDVYRDDTGALGPVRTLENELRLFRALLPPDVTKEQKDVAPFYVSMCADMVGMALAIRSAFPADLEMHRVYAMGAEMLSKMAAQNHARVLATTVSEWYYSSYETEGLEIPGGLTAECERVEGRRQFDRILQEFSYLSSTA